MKKHILLLLLLACTTALWAAKAPAKPQTTLIRQVEIDGLYYDIDTKSHTAIVTHTGSSTFRQEPYSLIVENGDSTFIYLPDEDPGSSTPSNLPEAEQTVKRYQGEVTIPATVNYTGKKYRVTAIGEAAFWGCAELTAVTIPTGVTHIGRSAFSGCSGLSSVSIPTSVKAIDRAAFSGCSALSSISIPDNVRELGSCAFFRCNNLKDITLGEGITRINSRTFFECDSLRSIHIGRNMASIGDRAFYLCASLREIALPSGMTSVDHEAFYGCSSLKSIVIPASVTHISTGVFAACDELVSIVVDSANATYDSRENCNAVILTGSNMLMAGCRTTHIPGSITTIGDSAFYKCTNLSAIWLPASTTHIGAWAFSGCKSLEEIYLPERLPEIKNGAFFACSKLNTITIPDSVTHIGSNAFSCCYALTSVTIPMAVKEIGRSAFSNCESLREVHISNILDWCKIIFHDSESNPLSNAGNLYIYDMKVTELTIPNGVQRIGSYAFCGGRGIFSITIPESISVIGREAFKGVRSIRYYGKASGSPWGAAQLNGFKDDKLLFTDATRTQLIGCSPTIKGALVLPASVIEIGDSAFVDCRELSAITIPEAVSRIGNCAFNNCTGLQSVVWNARNCILDIEEDGTTTPPFRELGIRDFTFGNHVESIPTCLCQQLNELRSITLPKSVQYVGDYAFCDCPKLTKPIFNAQIFACLPESHTGAYTIPKGIKTIAGGAFYKCSKLSAITFPASVDTIGTAAFMSCSSLTSLIIPENIKSLSQGLNFADCPSLTSIRWNARNCSLDKDRDGEYYEPFVGDSLITSFTFDEQIEVIPAALCQGMSSLTSLTIPNNTKAIGEYAFYGCSGLTSLKLPAKTAQVGDFAFQGCTGLTAPMYNGFVFAFMPPSYSGAYNIPDNGLQTIAGGAFINCEQLTAVTIPESVRTIGYDAFFGCESLTSVTIPEGVTTIGKGGTFQLCTTLTSVHWNAINCEIEKLGQGNYFPPFYQLENITEFIFGDKVQSIPACLCCGLKGLTTFSIPESVTHIGDYAYTECTGLTSVTIPNTVKYVGTGAFMDCTNLTAVTIPDSLESIGEGSTFQRCTSLTKVRWNAINCTIEESAPNFYYPPFMNLNSITEFSFGGKVKRIPPYLCVGLGNLSSVTIPAGVTQIGAQAFKDCSSLKNIRMKGSTPPILGNEVFSTIAPDAVFTVPQKGFKKYQEAAGWKELKLEKYQKSQKK